MVVQKRSLFKRRVGIILEMRMYVSPLIIQQPAAQQRDDTEGVGRVYSATAGRQQPTAETGGWTRATNAN